jgi:hypothetical protein
VCEAICSGIFNDLGSGSNVDICVITKVCGSSIHTIKGQISFCVHFFFHLLNFGLHR